MTKQIHKDNSTPRSSAPSLRDLAVLSVCPSIVFVLSEQATQAQYSSIKSICCIFQWHLISLTQLSGLYFLDCKKRDTQVIDLAAFIAHCYKNTRSHAHVPSSNPFSSFFPRCLFFFKSHSHFIVCWIWDSRAVPESFLKSNEAAVCALLAVVGALFNKKYPLHFKRLPYSTAGCSCVYVKYFMYPFFISTSSASKSKRQYLVLYTVHAFSVFSPVSRTLQRIVAVCDVNTSTAWMLSSCTKLEYSVARGCFLRFFFGRKLDLKLKFR